MVSSYTYFIEKDYWQLFINFEFLLILVYMNFLYKKKPLALTHVSLRFLLLHFIAYGIHGLLMDKPYKIIISLIYCLIFGLYTYTHKQKKYPIYFNPKFKQPF